MNTHESKEVLQQLFANKFKEQLEKEDFKKSTKRAASELAIGILILVIFGLGIFLPALLK